jgi:hypothetical protein
MKPLDEFIKDVEASYAVARRLAVDAYTLLATPGINDPMAGMLTIDLARQINHCAVDDLDQEIEKQQDKWVDSFKYPDPMPPKYSQVRDYVKRCWGVEP